MTPMSEFKSLALGPCLVNPDRTPWAFNCALCPSAFLSNSFLVQQDVLLPTGRLSGITTLLCRRNRVNPNVNAAPANGGIQGYCANARTRQQLVRTLVHEASHSCVGGHNTTNLTGMRPNIGTNPRTCDVLGRPDSYLIEECFARIYQ